jgi:activator of HSP90 ATPase
LTTQLVDLSAKKNNVNVRITSLDECNGDVDLNQRKGKLFVIYDLVLKFSWEGNLGKGVIFVWLMNIV